jgi:PAS domain S-box-containing protein
LRRSETLFRRIFEVAAFGIELVDLDGRLLAYNPAIGQIFGYSDQEIRDQALHKIDHPVNAVAGTPEFLRMINGELETYTLERLYIHQEGRLIWARVIVSLVRGEDGEAQYAIGMIEDITDKKQIDAEVSELNRRLIEGRESERRHLAQDLHDGPIQDLYGVSYTLKSLENRSPEEVEVSTLGEVQDTLSSVIRSLRGIMGDLLPPTLAPFGLEKAIRSHAQQIQEAHLDLDVRLDLMPDGQSISEEVRFALFRIYRICITNVIRHAHATRVDVIFSFDAEFVILKVADDGGGFSLPDRWIILARSGHLGLASAAERAQAIGGSLRVITAPGEGTQVIVKVPRSKD